MRWPYWICLPPGFLYECERYNWNPGARGPNTTWTPKIFFYLGAHDLILRYNKSWFDLITTMMGTYLANALAQLFQQRGQYIDICYQNRCPLLLWCGCKANGAELLAVIGAKMLVPANWNRSAGLKSFRRIEIGSKLLDAIDIVRCSMLWCGWKDEYTNTRRPLWWWPMSWNVMMTWHQLQPAILRRRDISGRSWSCKDVEA